MTTCIDLKAQFGKQYRVLNEQSYAAECGESSRVRNPWLLIIPCLHGHIYPHGDEYLGASTNRRGPIAKRLAALKSIRVVQDGSDGVNGVFHVRDFPKVAAVLKPKQRRQLTPDQIAERTERLRKYRFLPADHAAGNDRSRVAASPPDSQAI